MCIRDRTTADLIRNIFVIIIMTIVGFLVGFRPSTGVALYVVGCLLILYFAYALSWGFAVIGLSAPNSETAQVMSFPLLFPLTFISSAFVNVHTMPSWLQGFATYQPVSVTVAACRALMICLLYTSSSPRWRARRLSPRRRICPPVSLT